MAGVATKGGNGTGTEVLDSREAVDRVAGKEPEDLTDAEASAATRWFLDPDPQESASAFIPMNVAGPGEKAKIVDFKVQVIDRERLKQIREECTVSKPDGSKEVDDMEANLRTAVEALIDPDLSKAENRRVRGVDHLDPADALKARFAHKPGLIDQLATQVANVSGYDSDDVKELKAVKNS